MKTLLKKSLLPLGLLFTLTAGGASAVQLSTPANAWWWNYYNPYQYCSGASCAQQEDCNGTGVWCWCEEASGWCRE